MKTYTIKEIAKMANVSAGTVDRVLHNRGKVSPDKAERVNKILNKIDFKPNQLARSLKLNKRHRFVVLMPDDDQDEYWRPCFNGIDEYKGKLEENGNTVDILKYSPNQPEDFVASYEKSLELNPDGVLLGALYLNESKQYLKMLENRAIPYNLINTIVKGANYNTFVGQNLIQSGRTVAHLFDSILSESKNLIIVHMEEAYENAFHMQQKEKGFRSYFRDKGKDVTIQTINIKIGAGTILNQLKSLSADNVDGVFITTSKAYHLVESVDDLRVPVIGYDLLSKNITYLRQGSINFLIYQNPKLQAYLGLSLLAEYLNKGALIPKNKYLPIEIISSENLYSYQM